MFRRKKKQEVESKPTVNPWNVDGFSKYDEPESKGNAGNQYDSFTGAVISAMETIKESTLAIYGRGNNYDAPY